MKKVIATGNLLLLVSFLTACTAADRVPEGSLSPHAGEAVERNIAVQLVNPSAPSGDEAITMNGDRAALAQDRYARDRVKQPQSSMGGGVVSGGGGAGGGGGGGGGASGAAAVP